MLSVAFYRGKYGNIYDKLIMLTTRSKFSHVELVFRDGISFSSSPRDDGARFKKITYANNPQWEVVPIFWSEAHIEDNIRRWCQTLVGTKYDKLGILGFHFPGAINDESKWYCSEICAFALVCFNLLPVKRNHDAHPVITDAKVECMPDKFYKSECRESPGSLYKRVIKRVHDINAAAAIALDKECLIRTIQYIWRNAEYDIGYDNWIECVARAESPEELTRYIKIVSKWLDKPVEDFWHWPR